LGIDEHASTFADKCYSVGRLRDKVSLGLNACVGLSQGLNGAGWVDLTARHLYEFLNMCIVSEYVTQPLYIIPEDGSPITYTVYSIYVYI
jgi:hypothetical protein